MGTQIVTYLPLVISVISAVLAVVAFHRTGTFKSLDLRLQLRKDIRETEVWLADLTPAMRTASQSRAAVLAAMGMGGSGNMKVFAEACEVDLRDVDSLTGELKQAAAGVRPRSGYDELESHIVVVHGIRVRVQHLRDKYAAALASDDKNRERITEDAKRRFERLSSRTPTI